ncbi:MAG: tRNA (uracil-5-)-methyltransferase [Flavobacteriales bacterium]|jgi:tRNA (uracil-5-)-methyltransferase
MPLGQAIPDQYPQLLDVKISKCRAEFEKHKFGDLEIFPSITANFRMRAEFKIWHDGDRCDYAMYVPGEYKKPKVIQSFTIGSPTICELMPKLLAELNEDPLLRKKLFQVEFLSTTTGEILTTLIYHRPITNEWLELARPLAKRLNSKLIGRSRKQKIILDDDCVTEQFTLENGVYSYRQYETGFTQPNASVCVKMLDWACTNSKSFTGDLLELYCGNGNFTIPLAKNFQNVLATELSKLSVRSALENIELNHSSNIKLVRLSSEEVTQALTKQREFRRLKDIDIDSYQFSTVFVDPPRSGLDDATCELLERFENIIYISCNPDTLHKNLEQLLLSHDITKAALFDQFPYTDHRECGVILKKKTVTN